MKPRLVSPTTDPLTTQIEMVLDTLDLCAEAARRLKVDAQTLTLIQPYLRARMERMSVAIAAGAEDIEGRLPND